MDFILILKAIMLGLVEGATEFLPISSTGHLIIAGDLIDFLDKEKRNVFEIVIQLGSILSVLWLYQHRFKTIVRTIASDQQSQKFVLQLFVAFLPLAVLGLLFHHQIKAALFNPLSVAIALIVGGLIILYIEKLSLKSKSQKLKQ